MKSDSNNLSFLDSGPLILFLNYTFLAYMIPLSVRACSCIRQDSILS